MAWTLTSFFAGMAKAWKEGFVASNFKRAGERQFAPPRELSEVMQPPSSQRLRGCVDIANPSSLRGWVQDLDHPEEPTPVILMADEVQVLRTTASSYRKDLELAGIGTGCYAYSFDLSGLESVAQSLQISLVTESGKTPLPDPHQRLELLSVELRKRAGNDSGG